MKLSTKGRYGLRILHDLAAHPADTPRMLKEIAAAQGISKKYISRLIIDLRKAGLVKSVRGAKGGFRLARFPRDISLLEIVEAMEGRVAIVDCVCQPDACRRIPTCTPRRIWIDLNDQIRARMAAITLQMLLDLDRREAARGRRAAAPRGRRATSRPSRARPGSPDS